MSNVTALRAGRTVALVQRKRRRMHLASIGAGEASFATFCDRDVPAAGATIANPAITDVLDTYGDQLCRECSRMILLSTFLAGRFQTEPVLWQVAQ